MLFNSNDFLVFLALFLALYWVVRGSLARRNVLIVLASYLFYGWWDYRFCSLLLLTSLADYSLARLIERETRPPRRKSLLVASVCLNLGVLGCFKYFDFFRQSLQSLAHHALGLQLDWHTLGIVLPVGISFYTFQSMSYVIDVYRGQLPASRSVIRFLAYVSFFPQLVAGPIERATSLLPQFDRTLRITSDHLEHGLWLILWGLFQKVVLADNLSPLVELVYDHGQPHFLLVCLGTAAFGLQILCDFAGYSDIARGVAKLLGFELMINFNLPYAACTLREFWQRWHISLSTWIRDYLYIPLGGNRGTEVRTALNLFVAMVLAGLWHGAAWTFLLWGVWHGLGLVLCRTWQQHRPLHLALPRPIAWSLTLLFVGVGWMLFRAHSLHQFLGFLLPDLAAPLPPWWRTYVWNLTLLTCPILLLHLAQYRQGHAESVQALPRLLRAPLQGLMLLAILVYWTNEASPFIYFQF